MNFQFLLIGIDDTNDKAGDTNGKNCESLGTLMNIGDFDVETPKSVILSSEK